MRKYIQILLIIVMPLWGCTSPEKQNIDTDYLLPKLQIIDSTTVDVKPKAGGHRRGLFFRI